MRREISFLSFVTAETHPEKFRACDRILKFYIAKVGDDQLNFLAHCSCDGPIKYLQPIGNLLKSLAIRHSTKY
jgi:hypothetical protein